MPTVIAADATREFTTQALSLLEREFSQVWSWIPAADVLDVGCGLGYQAVAMALVGARRVVGVDIMPEHLEFATELAKNHGVSHQVCFRARVPDGERFDLVVSQNAMEHYPDPERVLRMMYSALRPTGRALITFGPPWFAPFGHHMHFFLPLPWLNLWCPERVVMWLRSKHRDDGARRYDDVEGGLNRMTLHKFERLIARFDWRTEHRHDTAVKRLPMLMCIPLVRELFTTRVTAVLRQPLEDHHV